MRCQGEQNSGESWVLTAFEAELFLLQMMLQLPREFDRDQALGHRDRLLWNPGTAGRIGIVAELSSMKSCGSADPAQVSRLRGALTVTRSL